MGVLVGGDFHPVIQYRTIGSPWFQYNLTRDVQENIANSWLAIRLGRDSFMCQTILLITTVAYGLLETAINILTLPIRPFQCALKSGPFSLAEQVREAGRRIAVQAAADRQGLLAALAVQAAADRQGLLAALPGG